MAIIILMTLIGIVMIWKRVYSTYKDCYKVRYTFCSCTETKATLKQFKDLYNISPNKFTLDEAYPYYFLSNFNGKNRMVFFHFSFIDWLKYLAWKDYIKEEKRKNKERQEVNKRLEEDNEVLKAMYESLLKDIEKTRKQGEEYIEQARETTMEVNKRMGYYKRS